MDLRWGQADPSPYFVPTPRIPIVGEMIVGPDDIGARVVTHVRFVYSSGFYFPPTSVVVETEAATYKPVSPDGAEG